MRVLSGTLLALAIGIFTACEDESTSSSAPVGANPPASTSSSSSSSSSSSGGSGGSPVTLAAAGDFCKRTLGVVVDALAACCTAEDKATADYRFTHDIAEALLPVCTRSLEASIEKKRVLWRADRGEACFAAYQTTYAPGACANITQTYSDPAGTACREAFVGVGAAGAPCMGDHECVDGLTCVGYTGSTDGSCKPPPAIGEACGPAATDAGRGESSTSTLEFGTHPSCVAGATCDAFQRKCVAAPPEKQPPSGENGPCQTKDDCEPAFFCDAGVCHKKRPAGGACTGSNFVTECIGRCNAKAGEQGQCVSFCGSP